MLRIALCDDNKKHMEELKSAIEQIVFSKTEYQIVPYSSGIKLIEDLKTEGERYDLIFLDINMPERDGISVARSIRQEQLDVDIIFCSVSQEHILEGYTYKAFSYLLKPLNKERLRIELERYFQEKEESSSCLNVNINGRNVKIELRKVHYFFSDNRIIHAVMNQDTVDFYEKLNAVSTVVEKEGFVRCHQSYVVNLNYINSFNKTEIVLENGEQIPISRSYQKDVERRLKECM